MPNIEHRPTNFGNGFPGGQSMDMSPHYAPPVEDVVLRRPNEEDGKYVAVVNGQGIPLHGGTGNLIITKKEVAENPVTPAPEYPRQMKGIFPELRRSNEKGSRSFESIARTVGVTATRNMHPDAGSIEQGQQGGSSGNTGLEEQTPSDFFRRVAAESASRETEEPIALDFGSQVYKKRDIWKGTSQTPDIEVAPEAEKEKPEPEPPQPAAVSRGPVRADIEPDDEEGYNLGITANTTEFEPGSATKGRVNSRDRSWRSKRVHE